jgi:allophanate hydrolase subunit 2
MGFRLDGPELEYLPKPEHLIEVAGVEPWNLGVVESPACGLVQVPGGVETIVLGVEGPSLGGYVRLGVVISIDMSRIGQARPGETVTFKQVSLQEAVDLLRDEVESVTEGGLETAN